MVFPRPCDPPLSRSPPRVRQLPQGRAPDLLPAGRPRAGPHHTPAALPLPPGFTDRLHESGKAWR